MSMWWCETSGQRSPWEFRGSCLGLTADPPFKQASSFVPGMQSTLLALPWSGFTPSFQTPQAIHLYWLYACVSLRVSLRPSPALTVPSLSSWSCAWLPLLPLPSIWTGAFTPGDCWKVFIILWMTLEADSIPNSSLSLWLCLIQRAWRTQNKTVLQVSSAVVQSSFAGSGPKTFSCHLMKSMTGGQISSTTPTLGLCSFSQEALHWVRNSTYPKSSVLTVT